MLTGTPALSRPQELYSQLDCLDPVTFPKYIYSSYVSLGLMAILIIREKFFQYGMRYCAGFSGKFGWDFTGSSNLKELHLLLTNTVMVSH